VTRQKLGKKFRTADTYLPDVSGGYQFLPFRFRRRGGDSDNVLLTNIVGEAAIISASDFDKFIGGGLSSDKDVYKKLKSGHFLIDSVSNAAIDLLTIKYRTKNQRIAQFTALHLIVASLRCDYSCPYCQVSRQSESKNNFG